MDPLNISYTQKKCEKFRKSWGGLNSVSIQLITIAPVTNYDDFIHARQRQQVIRVINGTACRGDTPCTRPPIALTKII